MSNNRFGKVNYSTILTPDEEGSFYYSYTELQSMLRDLCKGHMLKKVYVDLQGYLESFHRDDNYYDFSYFGGPVLLVFDNIVIEICVHGTGMVECRSINLWDVKVESTKDFPPGNMGLDGDNYFYDLSEQFQLKYEGYAVEDVVVDNTDCYSFSLSGFDVEKAKVAEEISALPDNIHFRLSNGVDFGVYSDIIEYFYIELTTYK